MWDGGNSQNPAVYNGPYGDLENKYFYEDLPDLLTMVPNSALGLTNEQVAALKAKLKNDKELENSEQKDLEIKDNQMFSDEEIAKLTETDDIKTKPNETVENGKNIFINIII